MVKLLDTDGVSADEESCSVLTVWAVLNQLSTRQIRTHFLSLLVDGMLPKTKESLAGFAVHQTISSRGRSCFDETRIVERDAGSAGTVVVTNRWQNGSHDGGGGIMTLLGLLVRVASIKTIEMDVAIQADAMNALRLVCVSAQLETEPATTRGVFALALMQAIAPSPWDTIHTYQIQKSANDNKGKRYDAVCAVETTATEASLMAALEKRVDLVVKDVIAWAASVENSVGGQEKQPLMAHAFFQLLLFCHFSSTQFGNDTTYRAFEPLLYWRKPI